MSLTFDTIGLELNGEDLILVIKKGQTRSKTQYLLHTLNSFQNPYRFIENLLQNPGKDFSPADFDMGSNSCSNLLSRANLKGNLRKLFFEKGKQKDSVQLKSPWIQMNEQPLEIRLSIQKQIEEISLSIYNKSSIINAHKFITQRINYNFNHMKWLLLPRTDALNFLYDTGVLRANYPGF